MKKDSTNRLPRLKKPRNDKRMSIIVRKVRRDNLTQRVAGKSKNKRLANSNLKHTFKKNKTIIWTFIKTLYIRCP